MTGLHFFQSSSQCKLGSPLTLLLGCTEDHANIHMGTSFRWDDSYKGFDNP